MRVVMCCLLLVSVAATVSSAKKPAGSSKAEKPKAELHVRAIDRERRQVSVELVGGPEKPPAANLFTFTDERSRHFVAVSAQCAEPFAPLTRSCLLELPVGYERHRLLTLTLHLGSLKGRSLAAPETEIAAAWDAAPSLPAVPGRAASGRPIPDGGAP